MSVTENVDKAKHPHAADLEAEVVWMAERLRETRALIKDAPVVMPYDNGGGQKGLRKNPMYEAYAQLFATFASGVKLLDATLENAAPTSEEGQMTLDSIRVTVNPLKAAGL